MSEVETRAVGPIRPLPTDLTVGAVYVLSTRRKSQLLRFICEDAENSELVFKKIDFKWNKVAKNAVALDCNEVGSLVRNGRFVESNEAVRPLYTDFTDSELRNWSPKVDEKFDEWLRQRDSAYEMIRPLVESGDRASARESNALLLKAYSPRYCRLAVRERAEELGVRELHLLRLLHKFAWFGLNKNALLSQDASKGRTGPFVRTYKLKPGPKTALETVFGEKFGRNARSPRDLAIFTAALDTYWVAGHMSLAECYRRMTEDFYVQKNQHGVSALGGSLVPSEDQFRYSARLLIKTFGLRAKRQGPADAEGLVQARGRDTDIAMRVGHVYDIDGTPFTRQLVSRFKTEEGETLNVGLPTVLLVFDRRSKKVVGWHVYLGNENWKEGYRLALLCAMSSKLARLQWLGLEQHADAWPDEECIRPEFIYVDGGAAASTLGAKALKLLNIDLFQAPPRTPYWKPTVEGGLGAAQKKQAHSGGGYERTNDSVEKEAKRLAKLHANTNVWEFERVLVEDIMEYNDKIRPGLATTSEFKEMGVVPSPNDIFRKGVTSAGGLARRRLEPAQLWLRLAESRPAVTVTVEGVRLHRAVYVSAVLRRHRQVLGKNFQIAVFFDPLRPMRVYWFTPDGTLDTLERTRAGNEDFGNASVHDIERYELSVSALAQLQATRRPGKKLLSKRQRMIVDDAAGVGRVRVRKSATKHQGAVRALDATLDLNRRGYDQADAFLAGHRSGRSSPAESNQNAFMTAFAGKDVAAEDGALAAAGELAELLDPGRGALATASAAVQQGLPQSTLGRPVTDEEVAKLPSSVTAQLYERLFGDEEDDDRR